MIKLFRSQPELLERIVARMDRPEIPEVMLAEVSEYMKQAVFIPLAMKELYQDIAEDHETPHIVSTKPCSCLNLWLHPENNDALTNLAYRSLSHLESAARRSDGARFTRIAAQFRAWKWLLGHPNADILFDQTFDYRRSREQKAELVEWLTRELMHDHWIKCAGNDYAKRKNHQAVIERMKNEAVKRSTQSQAVKREAVSARRDR